MSENAESLQICPKRFPHFDRHPLQKGKPSFKYAPALIVVGKRFWDKLYQNALKFPRDQIYFHITCL
jgi:hypothetical protein